MLLKMKILRNIEISYMLASVVIGLTSGELTAVVDTTSGRVQGELLTTKVNSVKYASFVGIRYGQPPVGYLRFQPPVPVVPRSDILIATSEVEDCAQMDVVTEAISGTEDCLFLNIATPVTNLQEIPTKLKSVMVWFYGGGFWSGTSLRRSYSPDYLIEMDVVYVCANYRLGAFGFLSLNHPNATGNAGLKDQNLVLKWIRDNIKNFGGDPNNVTLFGQSAGAASIGYHTLSDASAGLFHGTISMSGTALVPWGFTTPKKALIAAKKLGILMGVFSDDKEQLLKGFYEASTYDLIIAASIVRRKSPFLPTLEDTSFGTDVFLSECSINKYVTGNYSKVPQILGFVQHENSIFLTLSSSFVSSIGTALKAYPSPVITKLIDSYGSLEKLFYRRNDSSLKMIVKETSDILFASYIDLTQTILVANNDDEPIYYYHFTFDANVPTHDSESYGKYYSPTHNEDLSYVFWYPEMNDHLGANDNVALTVQRVSTMWTNFAKYGNPTPHWIEDNRLNVTWPSSGRTGSALEIGNELKVVSRPMDLNGEIVKSAIAENIAFASGCSVTTIQTHK